MNDHENVAAGTHDDEDELEMIDVGKYGKTVLETIEFEDRRFDLQEQISTHISMSNDIVEYIRAVSLVVSIDEVVIIRGMISYGKTYLYEHLYDTIVRMRGYERKLIIKNKFARKVISRGIPSPVVFNNKERVGIRLVSSIHGALLNFADEIHLDRKYIVELSMWIAFKSLFEENNDVNEMLKGDRGFIKNITIYKELELIIKERYDDYEQSM